MKYKKIKYNIICLISCLLIGVAVLCNLFVFKHSGFSDGNNPAQSDDIDDGNNGPQDNNEPSDSDDINDNNDNNNDSDNVVVDDFFDPNLPSTQFPAKFLNYCIKKTTSCVGYHAQTMVRSEFNAAGSVQITFSTDCQIYKSGDCYYEYASFVPNKTASPYTTYKYAQLRYYDGEKSHIWKCPENVYDISKSTYQTKNKRISFDNSMLEPCPQFDKSYATVKVTAEMDKKTKKTQYIATVIIPDLNDCPESVRREYDQVKSFASRIDTISQSIEFLITENGYITQISKRESFSGNAFGFDLSGYITNIMKLDNINKPQSYTLPEIPNKA